MASKLLAALAVFVGGCLGAGFRAALCLLHQASWAWPWIIFGINIGGAFLLGIIDALVAAKGAPAFKRFASFAGTGIMGAFTTYGTFVDETRGMWLAGRGFASVAYAFSSLAAGIVLAGFGLYLGRKIFGGSK